MPTFNNLTIITQGDPNGIGPEVLIKTISHNSFKDFSKYIIIANKKTLDFYSSIAGFKLKYNFINLDEITLSSSSINLLDLSYIHNITPGVISKNAGEIALQCIDTAFKLISTYNIKKLITLPVSKKAISLSLETFKGHTEYLAALAKSKNTTMLMLSPKLIVSLVTTHIPLKDVPSSINPSNVLNTIINTHDFLKKIKPNKHNNIGICGLNPHAGEDGLLGCEEENIIIPALNKARELNINVFGPISPDSIFRTKFDAVIALYHDQGLIPLKLMAGHSALNISLGLPFLRVSVDHGTAFDIAGQNIAKNESLLYAIKQINLLNK